MNKTKNYNKNKDKDKIWAGLSYAELFQLAIFLYRLHCALNIYYGHKGREKDIDELHQRHEKLEESSTFCLADSVFASQNEFTLTECK